MDFNSMGSLDAQNEVSKFGIDTSTGELKPASIRTTAPYLELLAHVSEKMGVSRQSFMSKLIEQMASEAVADYLAGYASYMGIEDIDGSMFLEGGDAVDTELLNKFVAQVDNNLLRMRLCSEGIKALPDDHPFKVEYFKNAINKMGV